MPHVIEAGCIDEKDRACVDVCPVDCIYEGSRKLYIQPDECIDCGACLPECPNDAIFVDMTRPSDPHVADNRNFFYDSLPGRSEPLGSPGGAIGAGVIGADTALVQSHPLGVVD